MLKNLLFRCVDRVTFSDFSSKYAKDERYRNIEKLRDREHLFDDFMHDVRKREKDERRVAQEKVSFIGILYSDCSDVFSVSKASSWVVGAVQLCRHAPGVHGIEPQIALERREEEVSRRSALRTGGEQQSTRGMVPWLRQNPGQKEGQGRRKGAALRWSFWTRWTFSKHKFFRFLL